MELYVNAAPPDTQVGGGRLPGLEYKQDSSLSDKGKLNGPLASGVVRRQMITGQLPTPT